MSISIVISTYNRQELLTKCLESVKHFADEIIVVDNTSADDSVKVAKKYTKKVFVRPNNLMLNINKNFGISHATKEWILYLDDDEEVSKELSQEIQEITVSQNLYEAYHIPRKNIIFGKWIEHTGWYPDYQLRLFKKGLGKFAEVHVHEMLSIQGEVGTLTHPLIHQNYRTMREFISKTALIYAPNEADVLLKQGYVFSSMDVLKMPFKEFVSRYFARSGYKDGLHGLTLSLLMAFYHLLVFGFLWENHKFSEVNSQEILSQVAKEGKHMQKELSYWYSSSQLTLERNPFKKMFLLMQRKLAS